MLRRILIVAIAFAILAAPRATAATVALEPVQYCGDVFDGCRYGTSESGLVLSYGGQPGERNQVGLRRDGGTLVVEDRGAPLRPGPGCVAAADGTARCDVTTRPLVGWRVDGGDESDVVAVLGALAPATAIGQPRLLLGGAGDDVLAGGDDADTLVGGPGADRLAGGGGDDRFFSDGTSDRADGAEPDVADGGPGLDTADYGRREAALRIDLRGPRAGGGQAGEGDRLGSVERVVGGRGADLLLGSDGPDRLEGGDGADRLSGRAGDDVLVGGLGADVLSGGGGDDELGTGREHAGIGAAAGDRARCGSGRDVVGEHEDDPFFGDGWVTPDANDAVGPDCEQVQVSVLGDQVVARIDPRLRQRGRRAWTWRNPCFTSHGVSRCTGQIRLSLPGRPGVLAHATLGGGRDVTVRLGPKAARALGRASRVGVRIDLRARARFHRRQPIAFTLALR